MQPKKPLSEYTIAGLLFIGAQTQDTAVKSAVLTELRNRRRAGENQKNAVEHNRIEKEKLKIELEIEGLRSKDEQVRRRANRDLFAEMKDRAFEVVTIPEGLSPADTVRKYNRDIHAKAKELYNDFKRAHKTKVIKERRARIEKERKTYRNNQALKKKLKKIESTAYQNARFPLIGTAVYYADTTSNEKQIGIIRGFSYRKNLCAFVVRIKAADGTQIGRAFSAIDPVDNVEWFNEIRASYTEFERCERIVKERDNLLLRVEMFHKRIAELDPVVADYLQSDFRKNWFAADEVAKAFARDIRSTNERTLF